MMPMPPPPLRAGDTRPAGLSRSTVLPDIDFETYSEAGYFFDAERRKWHGPAGAAAGKKGLPVIGAANYAMHPTTEVLSLAWNLKDGTGPQLWTPGAPSPEPLLDHVRRGGPIEAWNCAFEWWIWNFVCTRMGWPELRQEQLFDAMAKARAHALPGALAEAGRILQIQHQKDADGDRLLKKFSMPRNPTKADPSLRVRPQDDPEDAENLYAYNLRDIVAESEASLRTPDLCELELAIWRTDQKINRRGIAIDLPAVDSCISLIRQAHALYGEELKALAGCFPTELQQLKGWLSAQGVHMPSMDEDAITEALQDPFMPENARRALEIRAAVGSASVKKVFAMRNQVSPLGRLHDLYTYHGARTGRPTGNGPQPTNLPKAGPNVWLCAHCGHQHFVREGNECPWCGAEFDREAKRREWNPEAVEDALQVLASDNLAFVERFFTDGMLTISGVLRGLFIAAPGKQFISSDFSAIEGVVIAALAGEEWRLEVFRGHGKIYEMSAAKILGIPFEDFLTHRKETGQHHPARQNPGKIAELGLGFGGWVNAWKQFGGPGTDAEIKDNILAWRDASPAIVHFWGGQRKDWKPCLYGLEGAAITALQNPGREVPVERLNGTPTGISYVYHGDALYCRVPSGGLITYHRPRLRPAEQEWRGLSISYEGWNTNPKSGPPGWIRMDTYSGKLAENCVAGETLVLTDSGWKRLDGVTGADLVHDGVEFVAHAGLVCKGPQECVVVDGVRMTPEHEVLTNEGWTCAAESPRPHRPEIRGADHAAVPGEEGVAACPLVYDIVNAGPRHRFVVLGQGGPFIVHNCVQRVARDIQMHAIEQLEAAGYPIVMHTYDEVVAEVPEGFGSVEELEAIMADLPAWAKGWPIKAAGGWVANRYRKG